MIKKTLSRDPRILGGQKVPQKLEAPKVVNSIGLLPKSTPWIGK